MRYKLTDNTIVYNGITLYQIKAINDFNGVKKGTLGGYIESTDNLVDNAWVSDDARVYGNAKVCDNARVLGKARVSGEAIVTRSVFNIHCVYNLTMTDNHIQYGCIQKTIEEWKQFLDSDEVIETPRDTNKFKRIQNTLEFVIREYEL